MSRDEYLRILARELSRLPKEEFDRAMEYYTEYFEEAGPENAEVVMADLGSPVEVAREIIRETALKRMDEPIKSMKKGFSSIWIVILAIFAAPIALPVAILLLAVLVMLLAAGVIVLAGMVIAGLGSVALGIVSIGAGISMLAQSVPSGIAVIGMGLLAAGTGILVAMAMAFIVKWIFRGVRAIFRRILRGRKKK